MTALTTRTDHSARPRVLFIMGPTASGKTDAAIALSKTVRTRVISVDSALVYRGMDIGTAKPSAEELTLTPHQLIDIRDPEDAYSVADFIKDAQQQVLMAHSKGELGVLVGGTMLYHRSLLFGLSTLPSADPDFRTRMEARIAQEGLPNLHRELSQVDPGAALRIRATDPQRIIRALDVYQQTGQPLTELQRQQDPPVADAWEHRIIQLLPEPRAQLHVHIAQRFQAMIDRGFEQEVRQLLARSKISRESPAMKSVGYRQMADYLGGELSHGAMIERGIIATRQFAKRQFTWLRQLPSDLTLNPYQTDIATDITTYVEAWLSDSEKR